MTPHRRVVDDDFADRLTRVMQDRAATAPDVDTVAAALRARAREQDARPASVVALHRGGRVVAAGLVTGSLAVAGAGAAAAANPYSEVARAVETAVQAVGIDWSPMPAGYTRDQHDAFWDAGYVGPEVDQLMQLWDVDALEAKARAGQMILDGQEPPVAPGPLTTVQGAAGSTVEYTLEQYDALWGSGYLYEDVEALVALWGVEETEAKARAGQMILDGVTPPVAPSGTPEGYHRGG
ncbi:hypothetical protein [Cellulomonas phragmiteti]|uniref:Uncharacterized protein n=1 Tax=Cellulomonas phragmiteti TaxID=478780 RepID=A0ABQ4DN85_9CELL|nr:hypothetical protein [Cellulomonas phragmiteti]GIG40798.1 hypothetical protein Cph01nite_25600 [Cellulomonas phragmiteti]